MSLTTVLDKIKKLEVHANENVDEGPLETLGARRGRKRQAIEQVRYLKEEYINELQKNSVFIVAVGSEKDTYATLAKNEYFTFLVDPETIYNELANKIPEMLYKGKSGSTNLFDILGRHIEDKASELNLAEYNYVVFKNTYAKPLKEKTDLAQLIKTAVNEQIGSEIVGIHALRYISKEALDRSHKSTFTAIVLPTDDEKFSKDLAKTLKRLSKRVFYVVAGKSTKSSRATENAILLKEVNQETVKESLKTIFNTLKK